MIENHLASHAFFAADRYTIADIAIYAYTHIAHECGFDLTGFPAIRAWLDAGRRAAGLRDDGLAPRQHGDRRVTAGGRVNPLLTAALELPHAVNDFAQFPPIRGRYPRRWCGKCDSPWRLP